MVLALKLHKINAVIICLERDLHILIEEFAVVAVHGVQQLHILAASVHHRAAVRRNKAVGKVISALYRPFKQGSAGLAQETCHIVCSNIHGACIGRKQANTECVAKIQKRFRNILTQERSTDLTFLLRFGDQLVVRRLKKVFKVA